MLWIVVWVFIEIIRAVRRRDSIKVEPVQIILTIRRGPDVHETKP